MSPAPDPRSPPPERAPRSIRVRSWIASAVWLVAVLAALVLATAALLVALDADADSSLVELAVDWAQRIDGPFADVFAFDGDGARTRERLVGWGLAAVAYLVVGRVLDRIIRA